VKRRIFAKSGALERFAERLGAGIRLVRDFQDGSIERYKKFTATALTELTEPPSYFNREVCGKRFS